MPGAAGTQTRTFTYDKRGILLNEKHPEVGANGNGTTFYLLYDARGHAGRKTLGTTVDVRFDYDAAERLIQLNDGKQGNRPLALFSFDCIRFDVTQPCTTVTHRGQLAATARYNYDLELGTITVTQGNGYDATTGRLVRRDYAMGDGVVGGVTLFQGASFFVAESHNDLGLLDTLTYATCTSAGCPSDPGRAVQHGYTNGRLRSVGTWASNMTYRPNGMIDTITHGSGLSSTLEKWEADPNGMSRPRRIYSTNASGTQELWSSGNYGFDGSGNVKTIGNTSYVYDPFGRLSAWTTTGASGSYSTTARGYDEFGNHLYSMESGCGPMPNPLCYSTSFLPREMRGTTNRYLDTNYDGAGNVVLDIDQRVYTWDPLGMMTGATVDGRKFRYLYDANEERIAAVDRVPVSAQLRNRTTFTIRGSGNQLLSTWTDDWTSGSRLFTRKEDTIWRGSQLLARADGANTMNYTLDHLGSPRLITNGSGTVLDQQNFEPFGGGGLYGSGALQFTGHERDQANIGGGAFNLPDYMHARYYDKAGRFLSMDPAMNLKKAVGHPQSWNRYTYADNNPLSNVDPDGRESIAALSLERDVKDLAAGRITVDEYNGRLMARGVGAAAGGAIAAVAFGGPAAWSAAGGFLFRQFTATRIAMAIGLGMTGAPTAQQLQRLTQAGGSTVQLTTNLTQAPQPGRALSAATGEGAQALADAARSGSGVRTFVANVPQALLKGLERAQLVEQRITMMNGKRAIEYRFTPAGVEYITQFFKEER